MGITERERELLIERIHFSMNNLLKTGISVRIHLFNIINDEKESNLESVLLFVDLLYEIIEKNGHKKNIGIVTSFYLNLEEDDIDLFLLPISEFNNIILEYYSLWSFNGSFYSFKLQEEYSKKEESKIKGEIKERNVNYLFPNVDEKKYSLIFRQIPSNDLGYYSQAVYLTKL